MAISPIPATTGYRAGIKADDVNLSYGVEPTWGTPATAGQLLRATGDTLTSGEQVERTGEFDGSRSASALFRTALQAGGSISGSWSCGTLDDLLASVLCNTWNGANIIDGGQAANLKPTFLTFEKNLGNISWLQYPGSLVSKLSLSCQPQKEITWSADILSKTENHVGASAFTSLAAQSSSQVMKFGPNLVSKLFNGAALPSFIDQFNLTIENTGAQRQYGDGTFGAIGMDLGMLTVSGSFRIYFNSSTLYQAYVSQTAAPLVFNFNDDSGTNGYSININSAKLTTPNQPMTSRGSDLMQTFNFQAQKDATGTTIGITRGPSTGVKGSFSYTGS